MRQKLFRKTVLFLAAGAALLILASCFGGGRGTSQPTPTATPESPPVSVPGALRFPAGDPVTIDPQRITDIGSHSYVALMFSGLVKIEVELVDHNGSVVAQGAAITQDHIKRFQNGELRDRYFLAPDLATEIPQPQYNPDGTITYVFRIRDDARFSNGREVTADDFVYSFDRAADPKTRSSTAEQYLAHIVGVKDMLEKKIINRVDANLDTVEGDLPGVKALDRKTLEITVKNITHPLALWKLTYPVAWVLDQRNVEGSGGTAWLDRPIGTGSYRLVKRGTTEYVFEPNSFAREPGKQKLVFYLSGGASFPRYEAGDLDFAGIGIADLSLLQKVRDPNSELAKQYFSTVDVSTSYIGFNTNKKPFDDPKVRLAFAMAIDRESIARDLLVNLVEPAKGILPPGIPGYREGLSGIPFDPARAKTLLAESTYGSAAGLGRVKLTVSGGGGSPSLVIQTIIEMWRTNLGVEVELEEIDYGTFINSLDRQDVQMFSLGWIADYPDPENFIDLKFYSKRAAQNNETRYHNPQVDALIEKARVTQDSEERIRLYQQAEDLIMQDLPWIPLFHGKSSVLVKPYICNFFPTRMGVSILHRVTFCP